ncbi:MAG: hypothetical protein BWY87_01482 [Deltaproteobacteria bacterium ADurb.Bin510]|nr:MAG: hypothetical protein BWY87_01482 [Deltaproteobacteria bacterium ADurb.Bin510]
MASAEASCFLVRGQMMTRLTTASNTTPSHGLLPASITKNSMNRYQKSLRLMLSSGPPMALVSGSFSQPVPSLIGTHV